QLAVPAERHMRDAGGVPGLEDMQLLAGRPVPDPDGAVRATRGEVTAVGAERYAVDRILMALEGLDALARRRIPDAHNEVEACRGDVPAVGAERHAEVAPYMILKGTNLLRRRDVPHSYVPLTLSPTQHREASSVRAVGHPQPADVRRGLG